ncbi:MULTISPECIES: SDR family NAD(P)-dependent oxidoreductase [unclassified Streptomyces]|uniref:SDR family NAD(P)-dependent oxidoreductase n=1 Tax=unclassified Streptomyces TaxID=2593676 RepID=UPI00081F22B0|nr:MULTISPECIES: SDR family NAD(P)-dependent oxidoreductase [unclassified Streptomyces]MYZ35801.1 SDR family NAD(P)-dependent oxidoreductase [Streptomyces sp. SID4917]SCF78469.1 Short-chain dehydrogenase [Streptomyces sp. MnatMP-M17]
MSQVVAIFGAGSGLGTALGRRFGKEGFRVALIARRAERLQAMVEELASEGIEAAAFPADLSDPANARPVIDAIRERFGRIDVVSYQPLPGGTAFIPAAELDAARLAPLVNLFLLTPVEIAHAVLPEMTERGNGGFIVTGGFTAADPQPHLSGIGPAMSAIRNFVHSLHGEVAGAGVYAGVSTLAALIKNSESYNAMTPEDLAAVTGGVTGPHVLDPDELAETYWQLYTKRDRTEYRFPEINA